MSAITLNANVICYAECKGFFTWM